ncbi:restriction endonuclease subunit S [Desulfonatronovibrio hydrogenovorans]|uniref:restriction endonuclease subunit S n=1 Tax=Desulfonatronovibrio hydrogenovorans TaxID=53245 RepID=UPI00068AE83E|nr:restriction endonuclease subunit S [Desulfonatronovibrio hydrogenovorans]
MVKSAVHKSPVQLLGTTSDVVAPLDPTDLPEEEFHWSSVMLAEVIERGSRLEASVFNIEGRHARKLIDQCKWEQTVISGETGLSTAYHRPRFKRIWVDKPGIPIFQPSQITEINPKPSGYISYKTNTDIDALKVHKGQILLTCSGTIGRTALVGKTLDGQIFSHDLLRITCKEHHDTGYLYAFLKTQTGKALIRTSEYGAVVSHIEPEHLESIPIPNPPPILKRKVHDLIMNSYALRDESNDLLSEAERLLYDALKLPPLEKLRQHAFDGKPNLLNYQVNLSQIDGRLDASYHIPVIDSIMRLLKKKALAVTVIGNPKISKRIIHPARFARVYVKEGQGVPFFSGKQICELDPSTKKYLSLAKHRDRVEHDLKLTANMTIITRSGTIGKVALVPEHWNELIASDDIIRVEPSSPEIGGYLFIFLASEYGRELLLRFMYGSVQKHIEDHHVAQTPVPLLKDSSVQSKINRLALEANAKRTEAYHAEQKAIRITNEEVIHSH